MMALKMYRIGATKIKVNSTGSVIPVRKQVSAAENRIPAAIYLFFVWAS